MNKSLFPWCLFSRQENGIFLKNRPGWGSLLSVFYALALQIQRLLTLSAKYHFGVVVFFFFLQISSLPDQRSLVALPLIASSKQDSPGGT